MSEHKRFLPNREQCKEFTLFIDRDGVMNVPIINDYARTPDDLILIDEFTAIFQQLKSTFKRVIMVTNQQGIGRKVMSSKDLEDVHLKLYNVLKVNGIDYFDAAFYAPYLKKKEHHWRKPGPGMINKGKEYFTDIDWDKAIMVGDSPTDMGLADQKNILKVKIMNKQFSFDNQHFTFDSLADFVSSL